MAEDTVSNTITISGSVVHQKTGKPIQTTLSLVGFSKNIVTNSSGFFSVAVKRQSILSFTIQSDSVVLTKSSFETKLDKQYYNFILHFVSIKGTFNKIDQASGNSDITVFADRENLHETKQVSFYQIDDKIAKEMPGGLGDPIRALVSVPGLSTQNDLSTVPLVRGGKAEETRVFFNGTSLLKPYHNLGVFSVFSEYSVKDVNLYLGGFPVEYRGALSGVISVKSKPPSLDSTIFHASINILLSKAYISTPIIKNKWGWYFAINSLYYSRFINLLRYLFPTDDENLNLVLENSILPTITDYQFGMSYQLTPKIYLQYHGLIPLDQFKSSDLETQYTSNGFRVPSSSPTLNNPSFNNDTSTVLNTIAQTDRNNVLHQLEFYWIYNPKIDITSQISYQTQDWKINFDEEEDAVVREGGDQNNPEDYIIETTPSLFKIKLKEEQVSFDLYAEYLYNPQNSFKLGVQVDNSYQDFDVDAPRIFL